MKNPGYSAIRKAQKFGRFPAAKMMISTTAYSTCLSFAIFIVVDSMVIIYDEYRSVKIDKETMLRNIRKGLTTVCVQNVGGFACGVIGHAIGTMIYPGMGTNAVGMLAELTPMLMS